MLNISLPCYSVAVASKQIGSEAQQHFKLLSSHLVESVPDRPHHHRQRAYRSRLNDAGGVAGR